MEATRQETRNPSILIQFDPATWTPTTIFYNGATDTETAKLREIADMMVKGLPDQGAAPLKEMEP
jgi:hypothetical protein